MNPHETAPSAEDNAFTRLASKETITGTELKEAMHSYVTDIEIIDPKLIPRLLERATLTAEELADMGTNLIGIDWTKKTPKAKEVHRAVLVAINEKQ